MKHVPVRHSTFADAHYYKGSSLAHVAAGDLDEHQQRALKRLSQIPHELIQGPEARQLYAENNIHLHEEDPWEAGEVGDDHMTADTGASLHHGPDVPLHTSQDYLSRAGLEHFIRHPYEPGQHEERPSTWEHEGQHWINGGHHRILADRMTHQRGTEVADRTPRVAAKEPQQGDRSVCPCGLPVEYDRQDGYQHLDGSISHDGPLWDKSVSDLMKQASRFMPHERLFGPTQGLDHRLFDGDHLKPDVSKYILETLYDFWKPMYGSDLDEWSIVYFAGSEASEWTSSTLEGNNDFDVLIGVDYVKMRGHMSRGSRYQLMSDQEITDEMNQDFKRLDEKTAQAMIPVDGELVGPFNQTFYVNPHSYDIRAIKPYAAYDVTNDRWAVKPPALPDWDIAKFPEGPALVQECQAVASYVRSILKMPEPYRTQQGYALWQHLHGDRGRAFGPQGEGWFDPGNVIEKWLDQEGLWEKLVQIMVRAKSDPTSLNAPEGWSNNPLQV